jgi:hypothetical protein
VTCTEDRTGAYSVLVGRSQGKRSPERFRRKWKNNKTNLKDVGWGDMDWINLAEVRVR